MIRGRIPKEAGQTLQPILRRLRCQRRRCSSNHEINDGRMTCARPGSKAPVGIKVAGTDAVVIDRVAKNIEQAMKDAPGVTSALAERLTGRCSSA